MSGLKLLEICHSFGLCNGSRILNICTYNTEQIMSKLHYSWRLMVSVMNMYIETRPSMLSDTPNTPIFHHFCQRMCAYKTCMRTSKLHGPDVCSQDCSNSWSMLQMFSNRLHVTWMSIFTFFIVLLFALCQTLHFTGNDTLFMIHYLQRSSYFHPRPRWAAPPPPPR